MFEEKKKSFYALQSAKLAKQIKFLKIAFYVKKWWL